MDFYGVLAWGGAPASVLNPIEVTQRTIIKSILKIYLLFSSHLLVQVLPVLNVRQSYIKHIILLIFNNMFLETQHNYPTRNNNIQILRLFYSLKAQNYIFIAHIVYRNIPPDLSQPKGVSVAMYKRRVGEWLIRIGPVAVEVLMKSHLHLDTRTHIVKQVLLEPHPHFSKDCNSKLNIVVKFLFLPFNLLLQ